MPAIGAIIHKTRWHSANTWRVLRSQSLFKVLFILAFALTFEAGLFGLFLESFQFLSSFGGAGMLLVSRLFSLFFLGLGSMILVSSIVTSYSTIFGSDEIRFLLVRPFTMSQIVLYKFIEATGFASWAFFFIVVPFVGAYAWHQKVSPLFALWTLIFSVPFLFLFSSLGALVVMVAVRWMPRHRLVKRIGIPVLLLLCVVAWHVTGSAIDPLMAREFNVASLIPGLRVSSYPLNPSWWVAEGIMSFSRGAWGRGLLLLSALLSSALFLVMLIEWLGQHTFYDAWQRVTAGGRVTRKRVLFAWLDGLRHIIPHDMTAIIVKDVRTFFRDAVQWSQALVFFGLLGIYFANLRSFNYHALPDAWRSAISFLNIFAVSAVLSSLGSRFIYPQLSLEGHGFWLLGLSPTSKARILLAKLLLAILSMASISTALIWLSASMLETSPLIRAVSIGITLCISLTVSGVSIGLGAIFLDLRQRNPAAIVSGFGGTLNLVICLSFMLASILPFGILFHLESIGRLGDAFMVRGLSYLCVWLIGLTVLTTALPLWLGLRALERRDY